MCYDYSCDNDISQGVLLPSDKTASHMLNKRWSMQQVF